MRDVNRTNTQKRQADTMAIYYARKPGDRDEIYNAAAKWKNECLLKDGSLIWDGESIWTERNIQRFKTIFIHAPDESGDSFDQKLERQLENESQELYKFVIELLYVYYLFPVGRSIGYPTKFNKLATIASWKGIDLDESMPIFRALKEGLGTTGTFFITQIYHEVSFLLSVVEKVKELPLEERERALHEPSALKDITEIARKEVGKNVQSQHIVLHLLAPEHFERISSGGDKRKIVKSYAEMLRNTPTKDIDEQIFIIRETLEDEYPEEKLDFYRTPVVAEKWRGAVWSSSKKQVKKNEDASMTPIAVEPNATVDFTIESSLDGLIFENQEVLMSQIATALKNGKNIIFTGPPGTGKSKLASLVCKMYQVDRTMVTASSNWSTFDTIGGYRPNREGQLYFSEGIFLNCFKDKVTREPINRWLIIDEINRADIDKAFGSLFSVLTGDDVSLPFEAGNGQMIQLIPGGKEGVFESDEHQYVIPRDFRIIGTMNTIDKASLYEMSYAFMRRFAFIPVGIPKHITDELIGEYLAVWDMGEYPYVEQLTAIWKLINQYRKIGPSIVEDVAKYTMDHDDFTSAIILYVLPQFEGLPIQRITEFIERFRDDIDDSGFERLEDFIEDFFDVGLFE